MKQKYFVMSNFILLFLFAGIFVGICHHHCSISLHNINCLQIYCNYKKNPVKQDPLPKTIPAFLPVSVLNLLTSEEEIPWLFNRNPIPFIHSLYCSTFSCRAPPGK